MSILLVGLFKHKELTMNRKALFSGSWYPQSQNELLELITTQIENVQRHLHEHENAKISSDAAKISMAILPHAGLYYSGRGIAEYFARLSKTSTHFIILAPSHYARLLPNRLYYSDFDLLETPLGNIKIDAVWRSLFLAHSDLFSLHSDAVQKEHAFEMFLPFIKQHEIAYSITCSASLLLVPELDSDSLNSLKKILCDFLLENPDKSKYSIILSSDFTHYGNRFSNTFSNPLKTSAIEAKVKLLDLETASVACNPSDEAFSKLLSRECFSACGINPIKLGSRIAKDLHLQGKIVDYYNSNHLEEKTHEEAILEEDFENESPENTEFVSYCSIIFS